MPVITNPTPERKRSNSEKGNSTWYRFVTELHARGETARKYSDPRSMAAMKGTAADATSSDMEMLEVVTTDDVKSAAEDESIIVETDLGKVGWQPGKAVLQTRAIDPLLPALIDFAFYEAELRRLEAAILPHQATADADVALSYNIAESDRSQWNRLYRTMEELYRLRLQFARLEPHLFSVDRSQPLAARRMFNRLLVKAKIEERLEALSDRLEVLEDLYEGAIDRITDYRNYRKGSLLEIGIIVLLAVEVILLLVHHG
jgi:hypothetical protein